MRKQTERIVWKLLGGLSLGVGSTLVLCSVIGRYHRETVFYVATVLRTQLYRLLGLDYMFGQWAFICLYMSSLSTSLLFFYRSWKYYTVVVAVHLAAYVGISIWLGTFSWIVL
jgi:hypothetical protein